MPTNARPQRQAVLLVAYLLLGASVTGCNDQPEASAEGAPAATVALAPVVGSCDPSSITAWDANLERIGELVSGPIQSIGSSSVQVMGFTLTLGTCTGFFDDLSSFADPQPISSDDLAIGDSVAIPVGNWVPITGNGRALRITRRSIDDSVEIRGWFVDWADPWSSRFSVHGNVFEVDEETRFFAGHQNFGDGPDGCSCVLRNAGSFWGEVNSIGFVIFGVAEVKGRLMTTDDGSASRLIATDVYWYYI